MVASSRLHLFVKCQKVHNSPCLHSETSTFTITMPVHCNYVTPSYISFIEYTTDQRDFASNGRNDCLQYGMLPHITLLLPPRLGTYCYLFISNFERINFTHQISKSLQKSTSRCFIPSSCNERRRTIRGDLPSCFKRQWNISCVKYVRAKILHKNIA